MNKLLAVAVLLLAVSAKAQAPTTESWTNLPNGRCQSSIRPPSYFCFVTVQDPSPDGSLQASTLTIYVTLQPDGTFTNGQISKSDLYGNPPTFNATNWTGANLSGTFSGTNPDGSTFSGTATEVLGPVKYCAGKYGCHYATGVVSGNGSMTIQ